MKHLRMIGLGLVAAFCAGQANAEELTGTLKNIKDTGAITLGFRDSSIPFSYLDDSQKPIGFAMDICSRDRRRREEGAQARQARGQAQSGDVIDPDSAAGERHHRSRMRLDHQ